MPKTNKFIYWIPRILSIVFIAFLALFSLDVITPDLSFWQIVLGLLIHNIPVFILIIILIIAWHCEIVGGITFILAGILYLIFVLKTILVNGFQWYYLAWAIQISGIAFFIGIMFYIGWIKKKKTN